MTLEDTMADIDKTRDLLARLYESFGAGDASFWADNLADDVVGVGSDAEEWWEGRELITRVGAEQVAQMSAAGMTLRAGAPKFFSAGDVVWAVDAPTVVLADGTEVAMRFTLITSERDGRPAIRHFHLSTGAANDETLGEHLTTQ
jgi:ketosteroid isomerase-like protein